MDVLEPATLKAGRAWTVAVLLLSLPSVIFVTLHALYVPGVLPGLLDLVVAWAITLAGIGGVVLTPAACVVSAVATLQKHVPHEAKAAMWVMACLSPLAGLALSGVRP